MNDEVRCPQCGSAGVRSLGRIPPGELFAGLPLEPPWDGGTLYRCKACALGFRHPLRPLADYDRLYEAASADVWKSDQSRTDQLLVRGLIERACRHGSLLDVGCYDGALLAPLGTAYAKSGVELSRLAARRAADRGIEIIGRHIDDLAASTRTFDVVTAVDVIEHVPNPRAMVELLAARLKPGGTLIVSSGDLDAPAWRLAGGGYWYGAIPEHIAFVSARWARRVARQLGLAIGTVQRFRYRDDDDADRLRQARLRFVKSAAASALKDRLEPLMPARLAARRTRYVYGHPTLFTDHIVLSFVKAG